MTMNRRTGLLIAMLAGFLAAVQPASAQALRVGYADPQPIIAALPEYQQVQTQLQQEASTRQEALQAMEQDFQEAVDRYQKQQPLLTAERRQERERELGERQLELQQALAQQQQELAAVEQRLLEPLFQRVQDVIETIATEKGLDLVLQTQGILLYANEDRVVNINLDIARALGIEIPDEDQAVEN
jgi:outer membrane protein